MVEQMVSSNLSKYGLGQCASIMGSSDNTTVRNVQNDNSALQKEETGTQSFQARSPPGSNNVNCNLVYARRKSDAELSNARTSDKNRSSGYQNAEQLGDKKHGPETEAKIKGNNGLQSFARIPVNSTMVSSPAMEHWNARFVQLQKYLKQYDSSNQEVYLQKLRTFSPDECSRHAVELERRAIQLMLEEGREIERVKDLNVLGNHPLLLQPQTPVIKPEKLL